MPSKLSQNPQPYLYEINTWPWLEAISRTEGRAIDLGAVPPRGAWYGPDLGPCPQSRGS